MEDETGDPRPNDKQQTIDETLSAFLRTLCGANKRASTITAYRTDLVQFNRFLGETYCTVTSPADVTRTDIAEYLAHLAEHGISGNTRARKLVSIREYFRFLEGPGLVAKNPTRGVQTPKKDRGSRTVLRLDEYTKLLSLAGANPRDYAILQTGIRVSELCALTRSDLDFAAWSMRIGNSKGQKARTIELEKKGIQAIKSYFGRAEMANRHVSTLPNVSD